VEVGNNSSGIFKEESKDQDASEAEFILQMLFIPNPFFPFRTGKTGDFRTTKADKISPGKIIAG
jgi:hypothetical protein